MLGKLSARLDRLSEAHRQRVIERLARLPLPPGITATIVAAGIVLTGHRLARRLIDDPAIRSFGK